MNRESITGHIADCEETQWSFECEADAEPWTEAEMTIIVKVLTKWMEGLYKQYEMHNNNYWRIRKCLVDDKQAFFIKRYSWRHHWERATVQEVAKAIDEFYDR